MTTSHSLRLSEFNLCIRDTLALNFDEPIWIVAEVARINANYSGHTYIDLVEKRGAETLAQAKATIWRSSSRILTDYAGATSQPLRAGIQVLLLVKVDFHAVYGLSLNVIEIDASYSLGEMARKRQEVLDQLIAEGLLDRNRALELAIVPQRIAVISSATAAGWEDFKSRLANNPYGYGFACTLFPATLQGEGAEASIVACLKQIQNDLEEYDAVTIIRGGGGVVDLSCFDSYLLARTIAIFPLPVITGIGHERDTSVADIVAFHRADTPTAAAEYLIARVGQFDLAVSEVTDRVVELAVNLLNSRRLDMANLTANLLGAAQRRLNSANSEFDELLQRSSVAVRTRVNGHLQTVTELATRFDLRTRDYRRDHDARLAEASGRLIAATTLRFERTVGELDRISNTVRLCDPADVLKRGFSITRVGGRAIRSVKELPNGTTLDTTLQDGSVTSVVKEQR